MARPELAMLDVDGTLRLHDGWAEGAFELIAELHAAGTQVALCSGRAFDSLALLADELEHVDLVSAGGGTVVRRRVTGGWESLGTRFLPGDVVDRVLDTADRAGLYTWLYTEHDVLVEKWSQEAEEESRLSGVLPTIAPTRGRRDATKILVHVTDETQAEVIRAACRGNGVEAVRSYPIYLDVVAADAAATKGGDYLIDALGVGWDQVLAAGDGENDLGMLSKAGAAACMRSLSPSLLAPASPGQRRIHAPELTDVIELFRELTL